MTTAKTTIKSQQFKLLSVKVDLTVQCLDVDLSSNYRRFGNRSTAFHGDN